MGFEHVGAWNRAILNPQWLAHNLYQKNDIDYEIGIGQPAGARLRMTANDVDIIPQNNRVVIHPHVFDGRCLDRCDKYMNKLLKELAHTPIFAVGVNLLFRISDPVPDIIIELSSNSEKAKLRSCFNSVGRKNILQGVK